MWVSSYLEGEDPLREPVGLERHVAVKTDRLALSGRIDRIDERDGDMVVVDYKTGRSGVSDDGARGSPALAIYVLGVRRTLRRDCTRVELHHLPTGRIAAFDHTEESLARHVGRAEDTAADIVRATAQVGAGTDPDEAFPAHTGAYRRLVRLVRSASALSGRAAGGASSRTVVLPRCAVAAGRRRRRVGGAARAASRGPASAGQALASRS